MQTDSEGKIIDNNVSVYDFTKDLVISTKQRKLKHDEIYSQDPILKINNLKTYFPVRNGFFGGYNKLC